MSGGYFITGTDTGVGKTLITCALLHAFAAAGKKAAGMKPVASGCEPDIAGLCCVDVEQLAAAANVAAAKDVVNPYAFAPAVAPHIAAQLAGVNMDLARIADAFRILQGMAEVVMVEGAGGFKVPLNEREDFSDLARLLDLPVILVVGMRLGCLNHALLTADAVSAAGLPLAGWVANRIEPEMAAFEDNLQALKQRLAAPLLGVVNYSNAPDAREVAGVLRISRLG